MPTSIWNTETELKKINLLWKIKTFLNRNQNAPLSSTSIATGPFTVFNACFANVHCVFSPRGLIRSLPLTS